MKKIILASKSPRRHEILTLAGFEHEIIVSDADESVPASYTPAEAVRAISAKKASAVLSEIDTSLYEDGLVIVAADTVVDVDGVIFGKPKGEADAERMLRVLSGRRHFVHTGVTVTDGRKTLTAVETTAVVMREIKEDEIKGYAASGEPLDKAGAYAVQGKAGAFVKKLEGDYFNVMGLPLCVTCGMLNEFGINLSF